MPWTAPLYPAGQEPLPPGATEDDRAALLQQKKWADWTRTGMESCVIKTLLAGGGGFAIGAFFSLMSTSFAYEDPLLRSQTAAGINTRQKTVEMFRDMGRGMLRSGKGFGKVGALFGGIECVVESYRAKNDMVNPVAAGFLSGGILARSQGPRAFLGGAVAFAAFSAAIDLFLRREPSEYASPLTEATLVATDDFS